MADERTAPDKATGDPAPQPGRPDPAGPAPTGPTTPGPATTGPATTGPTTTGTGDAPRHGSRGARTGGSAMTAYRKRAASVLATIVSVVTTAVVAVLVVHIVFVAFEANTANDIVSTAGDWAANLAWQFRDVFRPEDPKLAVGVNYGLAALVYLIIGRIAVGLIRKLA